MSGGHHQSSDLRKWTFGTAIGIEGLAEYATGNCIPWDKGIIAEELWHSAKYYLSLITDEGWLLNCTWVPEDYNTECAGKGYGDYQAAWRKRKYFETPDSEHSHWQVIKTLAAVAKYFKGINAKIYKACLTGAEKVWNYMQNEGKSLHGYQLPVFPPLGHDGMPKMFQGFYEGSALRYASCALAACKLFELTGKEEYKMTAYEMLDNLCDLQLEGESLDSCVRACFWESKESNILANNYYYFYCINVPMAFADAAELWTDAKNRDQWLECMKNIADQYQKLSNKSPFGRIPSSFYTENNDVFSKAALFSFSITSDNERKNASIGQTQHNGQTFSVFSEYYNFCYNLDLIAAGIFLLKAAELTGNNNYRITAQSQLDWIMGANPFDASNIEGVGYNQPHRGILGEFFPPVPQIPGAVFTGITKECFEEASLGYDCEYDMPMVGWLLYLYSQIEH